MASLALQSSRDSGHAIVVGNSACRQAVLLVLAQDGHSTFETECPYQAMAELARKPEECRMVILSLQSIYREELAIIPVIKARYPDTDVWLAQTDGRAGVLADALQLGADGIVSADGLHRLAAPAERVVATTPAAAMPPVAIPEAICDAAATPETTLRSEEPILSITSSEDPVLTADELRALLQEPPT